MAMDDRFAQDSSFSIIVPTYCEAKNIPVLAERIAKVDFGDRSFEVLLMDDNSQDGSLQLVEQLKEQYPWLTMVVRANKPRDLSQSIIDGFYHAKYPILITLDADLSHPPEKIPEMIAALCEPGVDLVIGSRYIKGGSIDPKWPAKRILSSRISALVARCVLFLKTKDPLSGFAAIRKSTLLQGAPLKPIGWKINIEIIVKCRCKNIREVPIHFSERAIGVSHLNTQIALAFFHHVFQLFWYKIFSYKTL